MYMDYAITKLKLVENENDNADIINALTDATELNDNITTIHQYWRIANTDEEFCQLLLSNQSLVKYSCYALVSKTTTQHEYRIRKLIGNNNITIHTVDGNILIGNSDFNVTVPNGFGSGNTVIAILDNGAIFNEYMVTSLRISINGTFYVYDCNKDVLPVRKLNGTYYIYNYCGTENGYVIFIKKN